jgi:hypothetical protein
MTRQLTGLAAIVTIDVPEGDTLHNLAFLVWRDCGTGITFRSGWREDFNPSGRDLEVTINDLMMGVIYVAHKYCQNVGPEQISVRKVPAELGLQPSTKEHMENKIVISIDLEQVAAALEDAGFEVSQKNVADIAEHIDNGGEIVEEFDSAFRTLIADIATDLKIPKSGSARAITNREK